MEKEKLLTEETTYQELENFFQKHIFIDIFKKEFTFESGEYGILLFHRLVNKYVKVEEVDPHFVKYLMLNGRTLILYHNEELDKREGSEINKITGFPVNSCLLKLKE